MKAATPPNNHRVRGLHLQLAALLVIALSLLIGISASYLIGLTRISSYVLSTETVGAHGGVSGYNLIFGWHDDFGRANFRGILYPLYVNSQPRQLEWPQPNVKNPSKGFWRDGKMYYAGNVVAYPPGMDTVVFAPDGRFSFIRLAPDFLNYGTPQEKSRLFLSARKRFPLYRDALKMRKLHEAGRVPEWAYFRDLSGNVVIPQEVAPALMATRSDAGNLNAPTYSIVLPRWLPLCVIIITFAFFFPTLLARARASRRARNGYCMRKMKRGGR